MALKRKTKTEVQKDLISSSNDNVESESLNPEYSCENLLNGTDKLKLMLLAWNCQNSVAIRYGKEGPDSSIMTNLLEQYQNVIEINSTNSSETTGLESSPSNSEEDVDFPFINIKDDEESEDETNEKVDKTSFDPDRYKAFNMFVRMFVDENLDRMTQLLKQPKVKVQVLIDSCMRQFPEFSERIRERVCAYLKSCRRSIKAKQDWENQTSRALPGYMTSIQAEIILSKACENESLYLKRQRLGLDNWETTKNVGNSSGNYYSSTFESSVAQDLSVSRPILPSQDHLNVTDADAVKTLITGYREAAAFMLRSANELEQLLPNQPQ